MRIAFLSWESLHSIAVGGLAAHVSELSEVLATQGHEVHVFTRAAEGQSPFELIDGVNYHRCVHERLEDFVDDMDSMCRAFVDEVVTTEDRLGAFDVIHAHDWLAANAMIWLKQTRGRRCILTIHSTEYGRCGNTFPDGISTRIRAHEQAGVYWADQVITVSQATKEEVMWLYNLPDWKVNVVHNGVFARRFAGDFDAAAADVREAYGIAPDEQVVLFCGRLAHQKGPDLMLEALPQVLEESQNVRVLIAGDGDLRESLEARAEILGLNGAVQFLGYQNGEDLPALYHAADIVCIPSRNEPFGIVVLEAWSAGKPVVVTRIGGPREFVTDRVDGIKIKPAPSDITAALNELLQDRNGAKAMGAAGLRAVKERFTWSQIATRTMDVYDPGLKSAPATVGSALPVAEPKVIPAGLRLAVQDLLADGAQEQIRNENDPGSDYWAELLGALETCCDVIRRRIPARHEPAETEAPSERQSPELATSATPARSRTVIRDDASQGSNGCRRPSSRKITAA
jgi:glycosyltransferase involved in cell wall biosynthesis